MPRICLRICILIMLLCTTHAYGAERPDKSWVIPDCTETSVKEVFQETPPTGAAGIWQTTDNGAVVAVVEGSIPGSQRSFGRTYLLVLLKSPRVGLRPGTVMGWMQPTAKADSYEARLFTRCDGRTLSAPKRFTITMSDANHMSFIRVHTGLRFMPWRLLPYMFRRAIRERDDSPRDLDGMVRIWPDNPSAPIGIRYL